MTRFYQYIQFLLATAAVVGLVSCKKLVETDPPANQIITRTVYESNNTAISALNGVYGSMFTFTDIGGISMACGLSADELTDVAGEDVGMGIYYRNALTPNNPTLWAKMYKSIYYANVAIEGLNASTKISEDVKRQLLGEAIFVRAFFHFYLLNLYGNVPLVTTSDYRINTKLTRTPSADVYKQIVYDLQTVDTLLKSDYLSSDLTTPSAERVRPNRYTAKALLSRVYLYLGDWQNALETSGEIINSGIYSLPALSEAFLLSSTEAIWQLQPNQPGMNTLEGFRYIFNGDKFNHPAVLSPQLYDAFESGDQRKAEWIGVFTDESATPSVDYFFPYKYKAGQQGMPLTEYQMVFRLSEQYLIHAEASAQQDQLPDAKTDIDFIRDRAGLLPTTAATKEDILSAIEHERQVELFTEWGDRWLNLKRTGRVEEVMNVVAPEKGASWNSNKQLFPIPIRELRANTNLNPQNPGYE